MRVQFQKLLLNARSVCQIYFVKWVPFLDSIACGFNSFTHLLLDLFCRVLLGFYNNSKRIAPDFPKNLIATHFASNVFDPWSYTMNQCVLAYLFSRCRDRRRTLAVERHQHRDRKVCASILRQNNSSSSFICRPLLAFLRMKLSCAWKAFLYIYIYVMEYFSKFCTCSTDGVFIKWLAY